MDSEVIEMSRADMAMNGRRVKTRTRYHVRTQCFVSTRARAVPTDVDGSDTREEAQWNG